MGYRSNVAISMYEKDFNKLLEATKTNAELKRLIEYTDKIIKTYDNIIILRWNSIKWYEEYSDISAFIDFINQVDEEGNNLIPYCFTRVGEDYEDIEVIHHINNEWELDCIEPITYINEPDGDSIYNINLD